MYIQDLCTAQISHASRERWGLGQATIQLRVLLTYAVSGLFVLIVQTGIVQTGQLLGKTRLHNLFWRDAELLSKYFEPLGRVVGELESQCLHGAICTWTEGKSNAQWLDRFRSAHAGSHNRAISSAAVITPHLAVSSQHAAVD